MKDDTVKETSALDLDLIRKRVAYAPGDIVGEKGYRGEYLVVSFDAKRDELQVVRDFHICTLGGYGAYLIRRATYERVPRPDDFDKEHWSGRAFHCCHQRYSED